MSIAANDIKTRGVAAFKEALARDSEAVISVRGTPRYVVMDIEHYEQMREGLHELKGRLVGLHSVSISTGYRIVVALEIRDRSIIFINVGSHGRLGTGDWGLGARGSGKNTDREPQITQMYAD